MIDRLILMIDAANLRFNSRDGSIDSNRFHVSFAQNEVSIPEMVRLIDQRYYLNHVFLPGFNSRDGSIDSDMPAPVTPV